MCTRVCGGWGFQAQPRSCELAREICQGFVNCDVTELGGARFLGARDLLGETRLQRPLDQPRRVLGVQPVDAVALREGEVVLAPPDLARKRTASIRNR